MCMDFPINRIYPFDFNSSKLPLIWFFGFLSMLAINDLKYAEDANEQESEPEPALDAPEKWTPPYLKLNK